MTKKDTQRKALAMMVLFFIAYLYVEKILTPYLQPPVEKKSVQGEEEKKPEFAKEQEHAFPSGLPSSDSSETFKKTEPVNKAEVRSDTSGAARADDRVKHPSSIPSDQEVLDSGLITIENDVLKVEIAKLGGRVVSSQLKEYKRSKPSDQALYEMVVHQEGMAYPAGVLFDGGSDIRVSYEAQIVTSNGIEQNLPDSKLLLTESAPELRLRLSGNLPDGKAIYKEFSFTRDSYLFTIATDVAGKSEGSPLYLEWPKYVEGKDTSFLDPYDTDGFVWFNGDKSERLTFNDMVDKDASRSLDSLLWLGFGNKYFATAILHKNGDPAKVENGKNGKNGKPVFPTKASIEKTGPYARALFASTSHEEPLRVQVFTGPKSYPMLDSIGYELKRLIDLGMTGLISAPLLSLLGLFYKFVGNYGLAIVLLTIAVKFCLYPLNSSQFKQMKALQALKPELDRIKEHVKDRQEQQKALMDLYKKKGVNPLGGCLPVLVQMPIFIGLYSALMLSVELRHAPFGMWVHDLSSPDRLMIAGIGIPVLVVLFTVSMMVQQWITPTAVDPAQKKAMMIMPIVMFFMFMNFPAGLALYWLTNNLFSIGQQQAIQYNDKHGKSGFKITALVALAVFAISYICTLL